MRYRWVCLNCDLVRIINFDKPPSFYPLSSELICPECREAELLHWGRCQDNKGCMDVFEERSDAESEGD